MLEIKYATHVSFAPRPTIPEYHNRLSYFMKDYYEDTTYSLKGDAHTTYTQEQIDEYLVNKEIKVLKKNLVEVSHATDLYLDIDGKIHKGPFQHPETGMEVVEKMYE